MTRITSQNPSRSPAVIEAGRRFQLPPRTEKRTQGSTLFSSTAKNLTSSVRFQWREDQVKIFEDWILFKGPNVMSADLLPLLRALDLDGYEDVKNSRGECVHDLIIVKVRRKLTRTKNDTKTKAKGTCTVIEMRSGNFPSATSPRAGDHEKVPESERDENNTAIVKREKEDELEELFDRDMSAARHHLMKLFADRNTGSTPEPSTNYQNIVPSRASEKGKATTVASHPATCRYEFRSMASKSASDKDLAAVMDKLKDAMKEFTSTVNRLPARNTAATLETAAHDTALEIEYLEALVGDYLKD